MGMDKDIISVQLFLDNANLDTVLGYILGKRDETRVALTCLINKKTDIRMDGWTDAWTVGRLGGRTDG